MNLFHTLFRQKNKQTRLKIHTITVISKVWTHSVTKRDEKWDLKSEDNSIITE